MPDFGNPASSNRPVMVRRSSNATNLSSGAHKDLMNRFESRKNSLTGSSSSLLGSSSSTTSTSSSLSSSSTGLARSRTGSLKTQKTLRDTALENRVLKWIVGVINEEPTTDYEQFIQDGSVLARVMTAIVFNSVPMEDIQQTWGSNPSYDRVKAVIREIKRYGVVDVFEAQDLLERRNIPKVTKTLAQLSKLASADKDNLLNMA